MYTDLPVVDSKRVIREFESYWQALATAYGLFIPNQELSTEPNVLVHLAKCDDFKRLIWSEGIGGFVGLTVDFEDRRVIVTCEQQAYRHEVLIHELAHNFNNHFFHGGPRWLNEGLAGYFQSAVLKENRLELGAPLATDAYDWSNPGHIPRIQSLLDGDVKDEGRRFHYFAWRLVHMLMTTTPKRRQLFRKMLQALADGTSANEAWAAGPGALDQTALQTDFRNYLRNRKVGIFSVPQPITVDVPMRVQMLSPGQAAGWWTNLLLLKTAYSNGAEAERAMKEVIEQLSYINEPERDFWQAIVDEQRGKHKRALSGLRAYVRSVSDPRAVLGIIKLQLELSPQAPPNDAEIEALKKIKSSVEQLRVLAEIAYRKGDFEHADRWVKQAIKRNSSCIRCFELSAKISYSLQDFDDAIHAQQIAIAISGEAEEEAVAKRQQLLRQFLDAAKSERESVRKR